MTTGNSPVQAFRYPPGLIDDLAAEGRRRLVFWLCFLSPFVAMGVWGYVDTADWQLATFAILLPVAVVGLFERLLRRFATATRHLSGSMIIHDAERQSLRQVTEDGAVVAEIDLSKPFRVFYPYYVTGNAIYHVAAGGQKLTFSSRIDGAEKLVTEVLRDDEWPPGSSSGG